MGQNSPYFLSREQFRHAIRCGLGRALLHLKHHPKDPYLAELREACITPAQVDINEYHYHRINESVEFLWQAIELSTAHGLVRTDLLSCFRDVRDGQLLAQLYGLMAKFAHAGDGAAARAMKEQFQSNPPKLARCGIKEIYEVFGDDGLVFIAKTLGQRMDRGEIPKRGHYFHTMVDQRNRKIPFRETLDQLPGLSASLSCFWHCFEEDERTIPEKMIVVDGWQVPLRPKKRLISGWRFHRLRDVYRNGPGFIYPEDLPDWASKASHSDILEAAACLRDANDEKDRTLGLSIFSGFPNQINSPVVFPISPQPLIKLLGNKHLETYRTAAKSLGVIRDASFRHEINKRVLQGGFDRYAVDMFLPIETQTDIARVKTHLIDICMRIENDSEIEDCKWYKEVARWLLLELRNFDRTVLKETCFWLIDNAPFDNTRAYAAETLSDPFSLKPPEAQITIDDRTLEEWQHDRSHYVKSVAFRVRVKQSGKLQKSSTGQ